MPIIPLFDRVYKPVAFSLGLRSGMGMAATFLVSGLLHEYIYWMHFHVAPGKAHSFQWHNTNICYRMRAPSCVRKGLNHVSFFITSRRLTSNLCSLHRLWTYFRFCNGEKVRVQLPFIRRALPPLSLSSWALRWQSKTNSSQIVSRWAIKTTCQAKVEPYIALKVMDRKTSWGLMEPARHHQKQAVCLNIVLLCNFFVRYLV